VIGVLDVQEADPGAQRGASSGNQNGHSGRRAGRESIMATKKRVAKKPEPTIPPELTDTEAHLLQQMQRGYRLETGMMTGPLLRDPKTKEATRPMSANMGTVKALQERGLISPIKGRDPLVTIWQVKKKVKGHEMTRS